VFPCKKIADSFLSDKALYLSTTPNSRAREGEVLHTTVDAEVGIGIAGLVCTRELSRRAWGSASATSDLNLGAGDKVLRLVDVRFMDT
jgi:hypothetical protein